MKIPQIIIALLVAVALSSCGTLEIGVEPTPLTYVPEETTTLGGEATQVAQTQSPIEHTEDIPTPALEEDSTPEPDETQFWTVHQDPRLGFRFAVPCYWRVAFPTNELYDLERGIVYHAYNYTEEYVFSFPRSQIPPENGAIKIDFDVINIESAGLPTGSSLREFVTQENSGDESQVLDIVDETINGQPAISAIIEYTESNRASRYILIKINDEIFLRFSAAPSHKLLDTPDIAGILNSITVDPEAEVMLPTHTPAPPPLGLAAPCIPEYAEAIIPTVEIPETNTACGLDSYKSLDFLVQSVQQGLQDRNTGGLRWEYRIHDPFAVGYWGGETVIKNPEDVATELANSFYAASEPGGMTFTNDREDFPPLAGTPPEDILGSGANIVQVVYSEGWGWDKLGAALLYFAQDECGGYYWHGLVYSQTHFDK